MKERGIPFNAPMVRAILDGRKTQTRRLIRHPLIEEAAIFTRTTSDGRNAPRNGPWWEFGVAGEGGVFAHGDYLRCSYGEPGDRLWVRETHAQFAVGNRAGTSPQCVAYRATCDEGGSFDYVNNGDEVMRLKVTKWTPSIFMPRWASRITLEIAEVRVQRLQEIGAEDVVAEGLGPDDIRCDGECGATPCSLAVPAFSRLWDSINGKPRPMLDDDGEPVLDDDDRPIMVASRSWSSNPWVWALTFRRLL